MRIYLDSNVFQDIKHPSSSDLLNLILENTHHNIYCFSEAHLYDLARDKTDEKFSDMDFISKIAKNHCWFFDEKTHFAYRSPREYYNDFQWDHKTNPFDGDNMLGNIMKAVYSAVPITLASFLDPATIDPSMPTIPDNLKEILTQPATMYDLMVGIFDLSVELSEEQKKFKQLLQYLHSDVLMKKYHEYFGIEGFEDGKIIDLEKFRDSYTKFIMRDGKAKYRYDLFNSMYTNLDLLGFVKGKPQKQALINLTNDGRHGYFGAFCDIVVTKDADMVNKTQFLYEVWNVHIPVLTLPQFKEFLLVEKTKNDIVLDMLKTAVKQSSFELIKEETKEGKLFIARKLPQTYFGYFNTINTATDEEGIYFYLSRQSNNLSERPLYKEIEYITDRFVADLGPDDRGLTQFNTEEIDGENWYGRKWTLIGVTVHLRVEKKLAAFFYENPFTDDDTSPEDTSAPAPPSDLK